MLVIYSWFPYQLQAYKLQIRRECDAANGRYVKHEASLFIFSHLFLFHIGLYKNDVAKSFALGAEPTGLASDKNMEQSHKEIWYTICGYVEPAQNPFYRLNSVSEAEVLFHGLQLQTYIHCAWTQQ